MNQEFRGRVALVTGASRGIGAATAAALAGAGATVALTDVSDEGNWTCVIDAVVADLGRLAVL